MWLKRAFISLFLVCLMAGSLLILSPKSVRALSVDDYFTYTYNFVFNKTNIVGSETFYVTVSGQATCIQDLPLTVTEAYVESRVTASLGGSNVILNTNYTISYSDFPRRNGETASASVQVPLTFPSGSATGTYTVTGYITLAKIKVLGIWFTITGYLPASQVMGLVSYQSPVLGGGGGTTGPNPATNLTMHMDENGVFIEDAEAFSVDKIVRLFFPRGTRFSVSGGIGNTVIIKAVEKGTEPAAPENFQIIGQVYNLDPVGAIFSPSIRVTFFYNEPSLPQGAHEGDLIIAWWDTVNSKWMSLKDIKVVETSNVVTGSVDHFTLFAMMADMSPPASFNISSLSINPMTVKVGESVTITIEVTNTGGRAGTLTLILKINDVEEERKIITIGRGSSETIEFAVTKDVPANYSIDINGLTGLFIVKPLPEAVPETTPAVSEPPPTTVTLPPQTTQPGPQVEPESNQQLEPSPQQTAGEPLDWRLLVLSMAAGMLLGAIIIFAFWRLRRTKGT